MKKYTVSIAVILVFVAYVLYQRIGAGVPEQTIAPSSTPTPSPHAGSYRDGSYLGSAADTIYGTVQVRATITGGKITDVQFVQYPNSPGHTSDVSARALPILKSETIVAQSANVAVVSGATQTSEGFQQSLAVALAQAN